MDILLVASAFNSLTQRVFAELGDRGHTVAVEPARGDEPLRAAVRRSAPELIVAPMLTTAIPADIWSAHTCLIVHPGPVGDRGPSSLDWAIHDGADEWGVTVLQAVGEMDAGDVWASVRCPLPPAAKSDLYRGEICDAASAAVLLAVERFASGTYVPRPQPAAGWAGAVRTRPYLGQDVRRIDWAADPRGRCCASCGPPIRSPACSTTSWAGSGTCTAGTRRTRCAGAPANCWPPGPARCAVRRWTARCGFPNCGPAASPAARPPSSGRPSSRSATGCRRCPSPRSRCACRPAAVRTATSATTRRGRPASCGSPSPAGR